MGVGMQTVAFRLIGFGCWLLSPRKEPFWAHNLYHIGTGVYAAAAKELQDRATREKLNRPHKRKRVA